jgi:hypothetical protein
VVMILIDLNTREGVIGRSYLEPYLKCLRWLPAFDDADAFPPASRCEDTRSIEFSRPPCVNTLPGQRGRQRYRASARDCRPAKSR